MVMAGWYGRWSTKNNIGHAEYIGNNLQMEGVTCLVIYAELDVATDGQRGMTPLKYIVT